MSIPDIAKLTDSSPIVVVGEVLSTSKVGTGEIRMADGTSCVCERVIAFIQVDEVLKGSPASGTIQVEYLHNPNWEGGPLTNALAEGQYLMFFLKPDGDRFAFAEPAQSSLPMSRSRTELSNDSIGDTYTRVLRHLAEGLFDAQASSQDRTVAIFIIDSERSPVVTELFKQALQGPAAGSDRAFRFELLAAVLRHKDLSVLPELETGLLTDHDPEESNARGNMIYALQQIDPSLAGPILIQALRLPEPGLRSAAASALASMPSKDAIAALFAALNDPDAQVTGNAINSLTTIFHAPQCLPPGYAGDLFSACVEHWRELAATHDASSAR